MTAQIPQVSPDFPAQQLSAKDLSRRASKARDAAIEIRKNLWPDLQPSDVWSTTDRRRVGFAQVPRVLALVMGMINDVSKKMTGKALPAGRTYLVLWLHVHGEGIVKVDSEEEVAYEAGYGGERAKFTFRAHMKTLKDQGFVDFKRGPRGPYQWVLLLNPYKVVRELQDKKLVTTEQYAAFTDRAHAVGSSSDLGEQS